MPDGASRLAEGGLRGLHDGLTAFAAVLAVAVIVFATLYFIRRRRNTPEERERRRRLGIAREGRLINGFLNEIEEAGGRRLLHYTYRVGAVEYSACQDVTAVADEVGDDPKGVVGAVMVRTHQKNPYNSIVVSEIWSGLRRGRPGV